MPWKDTGMARMVKARHVAYGVIDSCDWFISLSHPDDCMEACPKGQQGMSRKLQWRWELQL